MQEYTIFLVCCIHAFVHTHTQKTYVYNSTHLNDSYEFSFVFAFAHIVGRPFDSYTGNDACTWDQFTQATRRGHTFIHSFNTECPMRE